MVPTTNGFRTGNLLVNGNFSQVGSTGQPNNWNVSVGPGDVSVVVLLKKYLNLNAVQISVHSQRTFITLTQKIQLQQGNNQSLLVMTFWYATWIIYSSGSIRLEFYDRANRTIKSEHIRSLASNLTWTFVHMRRSVDTSAVSVKLIVRMFNCMGRVLLTNFSIEQVDSWTNSTFFVSPRPDGTLFIQWILANQGINVTRYDIYRGEGILSSLTDQNLLVTVPSMSAYGENIYESMFTDHTALLNTIYTYQVIARDLTGIIIDQTSFEIGQADLGDGYHDESILIALPRANNIHLSWRLKAKSLAKHVILYNGVDDISNVERNRAQLLGMYPVRQMKAIVSLSNTGPFLLISDDGNDIATAKLANLTRPRIILSPTHLAFIREKINQPGHAQEVFKALIKSVYFYRPNNPFNYCWPARDAALIYAITRNISYIEMARLALNANRLNYTIYDRSAIKLRFSLSTMARAQTFDWAYDGFTVRQRREQISDFQYAASIFTSYSDDHSRNPKDKASNWIGIVKAGELILHLTLYGEEQYPDDQAERRILFLLSELKLHLDHSYGPSGYMQEGLGYLAYTLPVLGPAVYLAKDMGISIFDKIWSRPNWHNLALHTISLRKQRNSLQFGVADSTYSYNGFIPFLFNSTNDMNIKAALKWLYDRAMGINSSSPAYDGKDKSAALLYYPYGVPVRHPSIVYSRSTSMISDNIDGFYAFRNRYQDQNDVLIALMNRNRRHGGWNANETFALSIISHDTTWARMPGKEFYYHNLTRKFSAPLIDGWPREPPRGKNGGYTRAFRAFPGQGGGYVSLDSSVNFNITLAQRDILVDMVSRNSIDTILAIQDQFIDTSNHSWHWQLSPDSAETNITLGNENSLSTFIIRGRNGSWLKGWLYNSQGVTYNNTEEVVRIIQNGISANFKIAMALGIGMEPVARRTAYGINVADACINFDALFHGVQCPTTIIIIDITKPRVILLAIMVAFLVAVILIIIGILMRKEMKKNHRVNPTLGIKPVQKMDSLFSISQH